VTKLSHSLLYCLATWSLSAHAYTPADVDAAQPAGTLAAKSSGPAVLRAQILLDRARFSPGQIDGIFGPTMATALRGFQQARALPVSGKVDAGTWAALVRDGAPVLTQYSIAPADVAGPFLPIPEDMLAKSKLPALGYETAVEGLGEKFHCSPDLLRRLNPGVDFSSAGRTIVVPEVTPTQPLAGVAQVLVDKSESTVALMGAGGELLAQYPATMGSKHDPLPLGQWTIKGVGRNPSFNYNPDLFWDAEAKDKKATIPPGPNNPVGVVWIDLSKPHYGIHGTPEPRWIRRSESHGCIRLTNWSALEVASAVKPGLPAILRE
jgi:lipoprotein-anchoring transpeptidase ErfK/SrfK